MRWLFGKDLRILQRSPVLLGTLVVYPIVLALLIGAAVTSPAGRPRVAVYSGIPTGHGTVAFGSQHLSVAKYARELYRSIDPLFAASPRQAVADVRDGRALAALIIPKNIDRQIQQLIRDGTGNPTVRIVLNSRNPFERAAVRQAIRTQLDEVQFALTRQLVGTVAADLQTVLRGGRVGILGGSVRLLGLQGARTVVERTIASLPPDSKLGPGLRRVAQFATLTIDGLTFATPELGGLASPIGVNESDVTGSSTPASSYEVAIAAVVLLMFVTLLIAAGMLALERSEHTYARLVRGLVRPSELLAEKVALAAACALVMTLVTSAAISAFIALDWGRFELWLLALGVAAVAFAALGVAVGALARDVSVASLLALLVSLPVAFAALVPGTAVSGTMSSVLAVISFLFPFRAGLDAVSNAFTGSRPAIWLPLLHLAVLALAFCTLARLALSRFGER